MARWALIATPGDKRTRGFCAALAHCGEPAPTIITWPQVAEDPAGAVRSLAAGTILRIDSPGVDEASFASLVTCGGGVYAGGFRDGAWHPEAARFRGLSLVLSALGAAVGQRDLAMMAHPDDILTMCDKLRCRAHLTAAGIALPGALQECRDHAALHAAMEHNSWSRVFIKPRWGSSGAGIIAYQRSTGTAMTRVCATTTLRAGVGDRLTLSKRLQHLDDPALIHALIDRVLADGAVVERWIPKLTTAGGPVDLRVVVIAGQPRHRVARVGAGTITNLQLDAKRLEVDQLFADTPRERNERVWDLARQVGAAFPRSWYLGIDVLLTHGVRHALVGEVNAWGDLLPGLLDNGEDTYTAEIRSFLAAHPALTQVHA